MPVHIIISANSVLHSDSKTNTLAKHPRLIPGALSGRSQSRPYRITLTEPWQLILMLYCQRPSVQAFDFHVQGFHLVERLLEKVNFGDMGLFVNLVWSQRHHCADLPFESSSLPLFSAIRSNSPLSLWVIIRGSVNSPLSLWVIIRG